MTSDIEKEREKLLRLIDKEIDLELRKTLEMITNIQMPHTKVQLIMSTEGTTDAGKK